MTIHADVAKQLLPRPPRPLPDGTGYDWREFDRWMQKVYALIGTPGSGLAYNIPDLMDQNFDAQLDLDFMTDNRLEVQLLRQMVEQLSNEMGMITNQQQDIANMKKQINDLYTEMGAS